MDNNYSQNKFKPIKFIIISVSIILIIAGAFFVILPMFKTGSPDKTPVSEEKSTPTSTPVPEPTPDKQAVKIKVLNGSGTAGIASKLAEELEDMGYKDIETGNADNYTYEDITIQTKEDKEDYGDLVKNDLKDNYIVTIDSEALDEDDEFDVIVIIGKTKDEEEPTVTPGEEEPTVTPGEEEPTVTPEEEPTETPTLTPTLTLTPIPEE